MYYVGLSRIRGLGRAIIFPVDNENLLVLLIFKKKKKKNLLVLPSAGLGPIDRPWFSFSSIWVLLGRVALFRYDLFIRLSVGQDKKNLVASRNSVVRLAPAYLSLLFI